MKNYQIWTKLHQSEAIRRDVAALDFADNDQRSLTEESWNGVGCLKGRVEILNANSCKTFVVTNSSFRDFL